MYTTLPCGIFCFSKLTYCNGQGLNLHVFSRAICNWQYELIVSILCLTVSVKMDKKVRKQKQRIKEAEKMVIGLKLLTCPSVVVACTCTHVYT